MSKFRSHFNSLRQSERGMISILTVMILIIVISLIVLGFAQLSRRTQRESLDRQLSTQAFYAAESGINDARKLIADAVNAGQPVSEKTGCTDTGTGGFYAGLTPDIDASRGVKYSCLLVDTSPTELSYSDIGSTSTIIPMTATSGNFSKITLNWQSKLTTGTPTAGCPTTATNVFSAASAWTCGYGVLRFDLVPAAGGGMTSDSLRDGTMTTFAVPLSTGGATSVGYAGGTANTNNLLGVKCTNSGCSLDITGLSGDEYYMRVTSIYQDVTMQVTATDGATPVEIEGAQAIIDSTGKAQDVLRRIQVNVPLRLTSKNLLSDYAIQSTDSICKRYSVLNGYFDSSATGVVGSTNRLCQP